MLTQDPDTKQVSDYAGGREIAKRIRKRKRGWAGKSDAVVSTIPDFLPRTAQKKRHTRNPLKVGPSHLTTPESRVAPLLL